MILKLLLNVLTDIKIIFTSQDVVFSELRYNINPFNV